MNANVLASHSITHFYEIIKKDSFDSYNFRPYFTAHYANHESALIGVQWSSNVYRKDVRSPLQVTYVTRNLGGGRAMRHGWPAVTLRVMGPALLIQIRSHPCNMKAAG